MATADAPSDTTTTDLVRVASLEELRAQGQMVAEFEGGHCLPLSATEALADALLARMGLATHVTHISEEA